MRPFILHEQARHELREAALFYNSQRPGLSERWLVAFETAAQKIRSNPTMGRTCWAETRQCRVVGFPYFIVFQKRTNDVHIIAVAHVPRRPGYWIDRLEGIEP